MRFCKDNYKVDIIPSSINQLSSINAAALSEFGIQYRIDMIHILIYNYSSIQSILENIYNENIEKENFLDDFLNNTKICT